jgi:uncharacterized membrane protein
MMEILFPFHPRTVHFPIALTLVGVFSIVLSAVLARRGDNEGGDATRWLRYGRTTLGLGWAATLIAIMTGLVDQSRARDDVAVVSTINLHITTGIALVVALGLALYWPLRDRQVFTRHRWSYIGLLLFVAALVVVESWLGGKLVYELGVGIRATP